MDFRTLKSLTIPEGVVTKITNAAGNVLWQATSGPTNYISFTSPEAFSISVETPGWDGVIYYSTDTARWNEWDGSEISGTALYMAGSGNTKITGYSTTNTFATTWTLTGSNISCSGNIEALLDHETIAAGGHPSMAEYCYASMFYNCSSLVTPPDLLATTATKYCYRQMFYQCASLIKPPAIAAISMAIGSCYDMFRGCTSLKSSPALPATTLAATCYSYMFHGCTSLNSLPALPATTLANQCYYWMFRNCSSIKLSSTATSAYTQTYRIPVAGTGTTATNALKYMFNGTVGNVITPTINTTYYLHSDNAIVHNPYYLTFTSTDTFSISVGAPGWDGTMEYSTDLYSWNAWDGSEISGTAIYLRGSNNTRVTGVSDNSCSWTITGSSVSCCGNIEALLDYNTTIAGEHPSMAEYCYCSMFYDCSALTSIPGLPATTLSNSCYRYMFYNCTSLTASPALPATVLTPACYFGMFYGCSALTTAPTLSAHELATSCYYGMFYNCTSLTTAPELPALSLESGCYYYMFCGCSALATAPALPATILATYCYYGMFANCTSLTAAPALPATALVTYCYYRMFYGCTALKTIPALEAVTLKVYCYYQMFYNCSSIEISSNTSSGLYPLAYRIPYTTTNTGKTATNALSNMFYGTTAVTGGVTTPTVNTTYGLGSNNSVITAQGEIVSE